VRRRAEERRRKLVEKEGGSGQIASDGRRLFWSEGVLDLSTRVRAPLPVSPALVAIDRDFVYALGPSTLVRSPKGGGQAETLYALTSTRAILVGRIALDESFVYFAETATHASLHANLERVPKSGGGVEVLQRDVGVGYRGVAIATLGASVFYASVR